MGNIKSNIISFTPRGNVIKIKLKYHSHRGHFSSRHPRNMLSSDNKFYASKHNRDFQSNENDWIRFTMPQNELCFPTKFTIKNSSGVAGVQSLLISVGNGNTQ